MRLTRRVVAVGLLVAAGAAAAPTSAPFGPPTARADEREDAKKAVDALASADDAGRAAAADGVARLDRAGAAEVARRVASLDDRALKACGDAFTRAWKSHCALTFVEAARAAPPEQAKRLLALAHALDPVAGVERTKAETAAEVGRLLDAANRSRCATGYPERIALLGHDAVEPLLASMRDGDASNPGGTIACWAVARLAQKDDLPAIRDLILAGKFNLVEAVERLRKEGVPEATEVLFDAAAAGRLGHQITSALAELPDRERVLKVVNEVVDGRSPLAEPHRANIAWLYSSLNARDSIPTLKSWLSTSSAPGDFVAIANALVHLGDPKGVELLVRIVNEQQTRFCCRPSTPKERADASAPGRLCPDGFEAYQREGAAKKLSEIAGKAVFDYEEEDRRRLADDGPGRESSYDLLDRAGAAFLGWWEKSKDKLRFDEATGRWTVGG